MKMGKKKARDKASYNKRAEPQPCCECGRQGEYYTDLFGIVTDQWRCRDCHERACRSHSRNDHYIRYGHR